MSNTHNVLAWFKVLSVKLKLRYTHKCQNAQGRGLTYASLYRKYLTFVTNKHFKTNRYILSNHKTHYKIL